jgi:hypothetical protein
VYVLYEFFFIDNSQDRAARIKKLVWDTIKGLDKPARAGYDYPSLYPPLLSFPLSDKVRRTD